MKSTTVGHNKYDFYIFLLIVTLVFGNLGGALMIVRILGVILLPGVYSLYKYCGKSIKKYNTFFLFFYVFCLASLVWTPNIEQAGKELVYYPVHFVIFLEILVFSRFASCPLKTISWAWVVSVALTLIVAVWEITTSNHLSLSKFEADDVALNFAGVSVDRPFAAVTFGNFNGYVTYLCFAMPFLFFYILNNIKDFKKMLLGLAVLLVCVVTILVDASRGGLLTILVMSAILFLNTKRSFYKTAFLVIAALLVVYFIIPRLDTLFLALSVKSEGTNLVSDESRFAIWRDGIRVLYKYCFIGTGIGGLTVGMKEVASTDVTIPHNMFLEILVQYGVVFFMVFVVYVLGLFKRARYQKDINTKIILYMAIFAMPIYGIIDSGYLLNPIFYVSFACLTVFAYNKSIISAT